jgi:hypothetical protein
LLCGDAFFAHVVNFMEDVDRRHGLSTDETVNSPFGPELTMLSAAIRACRAHELMGRPVVGDLLELLAGCLVIPEMAEALDSYGLREPLVAWMRGRFGLDLNVGAEARSAGHQAAPTWVCSPQAFRQRWTDLQESRAALRDDLWLGLFGIPTPRRFAH